MSLKEKALSFLNSRVLPIWKEKLKPKLQEKLLPFWQGKVLPRLERSLLPFWREKVKPFQCNLFAFVFSVAFWFGLYFLLANILPAGLTYVGLAPLATFSKILSWMLALAVPVLILITVIALVIAGQFEKQNSRKKIAH